VSVLELVERGRHPHHGLFRTWSRTDEEAVASALERTDLVHLAAVPVDSLSGGQRQRVWLAMVLAQATPVLLLDEPTSFLDIAHQLDVLDLVRRLCDESGTTVVMVLHDLAMAARYADHLVAMRDGRVVAEGPPATVVTPEVIDEVFGVTATVLVDPASGAPVVIPRRRTQ
jgi:iron complex transport system ATP-binding protein